MCNYLKNLSTSSKATALCVSVLKNNKENYVKIAPVVIIVFIFYNGTIEIQSKITNENVNN